MAIKMPEKLLVLFMDKGKQVSSHLSGSDTGTEIHNRKNSPGPTGNRYVLVQMAWVILHLATRRGVPKSCDIVQPRRSFAPSLGSGIQTEVLGAGGEGRPWKKSWVEVDSEAELEGTGLGGGNKKFPLPWWGSGAPKGENGYQKRIAQSLDGGLELVKRIRTLL